MFQKLHSAAQPKILIAEKLLGEILFNFLRNNFMNNLKKGMEVPYCFYFSCGEKKYLSYPQGLLLDKREKMR